MPILMINSRLSTIIYTTKELHDIKVLNLAMYIRIPQENICKMCAVYHENKCCVCNDFFFNHKEKMEVSIARFNFYFGGKFNLVFIFVYCTVFTIQRKENLSPSGDNLKRNEMFYVRMLFTFWITLRFIYTTRTRKRICFDLCRCSM